MTSRDYDIIGRAMAGKASQQQTTLQEFRMWLEQQRGDEWNRRDSDVPSHCTRDGQIWPDDAIDKLDEIAAKHAEQAHAEQNSPCRLQHWVGGDSDSRNPKDWGGSVSFCGRLDSEKPTRCWNSPCELRQRKDRMEQAHAERVAEVKRVLVWAGDYFSEDFLITQLDHDAEAYVAWAEGQEANDEWR